ncbi:HNH endonuclease family protein [Streptomyces mayteni]
MRIPRTTLTTLISLAAFPALALWPATPATAAVPAGPGETVQAPLAELIAALPVRDESRDGYRRENFKHWTDTDKNGCNARNDVLLEEAIVAPEVTGRCTITADTGQWWSWYDETTVTGKSGIDIDHMVPLAEAWDSGASTWTAAEREAYANDLNDPRALVAVSGRSNRSKSDQDPAEWMPPAPSATCQYIADWVAIKTRYGLAVDPVELAAINETAAGCHNDHDVAVTLAR